MKFCLFFILAIQVSVVCAQSTVQGVIIDQNDGKPVPFVSVSIPGKKVSVMSDSLGKYSVRTTAEDKVLVFTALGYERQEVTIDKRKTINVILAYSSKSLDEVVVVGYSEQKKINLTGAVDNVSLSDVDDRVFTDASQILQGKAPGLMVTQNSGQPGQDDAELRIRGVSSIDNNSEPLVIIDGVQGSLKDVNPNDIASMSILKDAAAASIYGNRAAGGVLVVTTKQGNNQLSVNYIGTASLQQATRRPEGVNAATYSVLHNEGRLNSGLPVQFSEESIKKYQEGIEPNFRGTDWYDNYISNGNSTNHYLSLRGGQSGKYNFSLSGGYLNQDGVLIGTSNEKVNYLANVNAWFFNKKLQFTTQLLGYNSKDKELYSSTATVLQSIANARPVAFLRSDEGLYSLPGLWIAAMDQNGGTSRERNNFKYQLGLQYQPFKSLTVKGLYAKNKTVIDYSRFAPTLYSANDILDGEGTYRQSTLDVQTQNNLLTTLTLTANWKKSFGQHNLSALAGYESLNNSVGGFGASVRNLAVNQPILALGDPSTLTPGSVTNAEKNTLSYFGRLTYNYREKYLFEANIRRDGSSIFSEGNKWGTFPSFSAGWVISKESFLEESETLNLLKLRGSWGQLGNAGIGTYYASSDVLTTDFDYSFGGAVVPGSATVLLANRNTTWETTEQTNVGIDARFFNRLDFNVNYFYKNTYNILGRITIPGSLGVSQTPYQNIGSMVNKGIELGLQYDGKAGKNFSYAVNTNLTYLKNKVTSLGDIDFITHEAASGYSPPSGVIRSQVGSPFGSYYGLVSEGIYQIDDFTWQNNSDPSIPFYERSFVLKEGNADPSAMHTAAMPGDIKFLDRNGDGFITEDDKQIIGNSLPDYVYALNLSARYKGFEFSMLTQGAIGGDAYLMGALVTPFWGQNGNISQKVADNRWTPENPSTTYQRLYNDVQRANVISSYYIQNASYLRVKNLILGYNIDKKLLNRWNVKNLKVFLTVENLLTISGFDGGFDPERNFNRITSDFHPQIRGYSMGINIGL